MRIAPGPDAAAVLQTFTAAPGSTPGVAAARRCLDCRVFIALPPPLLQTPRLRLRRFVATDVPALVAMHREPRVRALLVDDQPLDDAAVAAKFVQRLQLWYRTHPGLGLWHAERATPPDPAALAEARAAVAAGELEAAALDWLARPAWRFCGWFNLMPMSGEPEHIELGCRLLPDAWGGGLALEGGEALLAQAFDTLARGEVRAVCHPQHRSVDVVLRTLGFSALGIAPYDGRPAAHYRLDRAAWQAAQGQALRQRRRAAVEALRRHSRSDRGRGEAAASAAHA